MKNPNIVLYRILGNDLPPRHKKGQIYNHLKFILGHEPDFPNCQKKWIVNRIVDPGTEQKIINFLKKRRQSYIHIPFDFQEYQVCKKTYNKINYVINVNGARNLALRDGRKIADWIFPFDGNCCFNEEGWEHVIDKLLIQKTTDKCIIVPMYRLIDDEQYFDFNPEEYREHEPQIVFGKKSNIKFNESYRFGRNDKIELLIRLGFKIHATDNGCTVVDSEYKCGYVLRLFSGVKEGETGWFKRAVLREKAIDLMLQKLERKEGQDVQKT